MSQLFEDLKRRNVFRVGAAYAIVGWLLVEVASVLLPAFHAPESVFQIFTILVGLGFPIALVLAWAFEITPEGIKRDQDVEAEDPVRQVTGTKLDFAIILSTLARRSALLQQCQLIKRKKTSALTRFLVEIST